MTLRRHEVPTHLNVEDRAFYGLSARQFMYLMVGCSGGYSLWNQWPDLPATARVALAATSLCFAVVLALVRPYGRGLDEWTFAALHYAALPRASTWRHRQTDSAGLRPSAPAWAEWTPRLRWAAGGRSEGDRR